MWKKNGIGTIRRNGMININNFKEYLLKRISRADKRISLIKESHGDKPNETHNYFGGQNLGYWQGILFAYENILDEIEKISNSN